MKMRRNHKSEADSRQRSHDEKQTHARKSGIPHEPSDITTPVILDRQRLRSNVPKGSETESNAEARETEDHERQRQSLAGELGGGVTKTGRPHEPADTEAAIETLKDDIPR
jgi:hypothetical protein